MKYLIILLSILFLQSCSQCDSNPELETRTFVLQLVTGDTITKSFDVAVGSKVYVETFRGSYYLYEENYHACRYDNILSGVVYIIEEK
jgi:hypothetical protein